MKYITTIALILLGIIYVSFAETSSKASFSSLNIPTAPKGSTIVLYGPIPTDNIIKKVQKSGSWQKFLENRGITFPKGGYAIFDSSTKSLIAATTPDQQKRLHILLSPF